MFQLGSDPVAKSFLKSSEPNTLLFTQNLALVIQVHQFPSWEIAEITLHPVSLKLLCEHFMAANALFNPCLGQIQHTGSVILAIASGSALLVNMPELLFQLPINLLRELCGLSGYTALVLLI